MMLNNLLNKKNNHSVESMHCINRMIEKLFQQFDFANKIVGVDLHSSGFAVPENRSYFVPEEFDAKPRVSTKIETDSLVFLVDFIEPAVSNAMASQLDLFSSLAQLVGSEKRGPDSKELLDVFLGKNNQGREELIIEATSRTALRKGDWVMIPPYNIPPYNGPAKNEMVNIELGNSSEFQLYNLSEDLDQQNNLAKENSEKLQEMIETFKKIRGEDFQHIEQLELK